MLRKRSHARPLAALLLALTLALSTLGALHVAAHAVEGDGAGHCDACRVVKAAPLASASSDFAQPLPVCGEVVFVPSEAPPVAVLASPVSRGPPALG